MAEHPKHHQRRRLPSRFPSKRKAGPGSRALPESKCPSQSLLTNSSTAFLVTMKSGPRTRGTEHIQRALGLTTSDDATDLRTALSVLLPLQHGLTLQQTADVLGKSLSWVSKQRSAFFNNTHRSVADNGKHGGRRNEVISAEQEEAFLEAVGMQFVKIHQTWRRAHLTPEERKSLYPETKLSFAAIVRRELAAASKRPVSRATAYNLMARVGVKRFPEYRAWHWEQHFRTLI